MVVEEGETRASNNSRNCCGKVTDFIIGKFESAFFSLGKVIGKYPAVAILLSLLFAALCGIGMLEFTQENRGEKLWNPQDSQALANKAVNDARYPVAQRLNVILIESSNVLTVPVLKALLDTHKKILQISNGTADSWENICYRQGVHCLMSGLLEIWSYNETMINNLTDSEVLNAVNKVPLISPITNRPISLDRILGSIARDNSNRIIGAKAASSNYFIKNQGVYNKNSGANEDKKGENWETELGKVVKNVDAIYSSVKFFFYSQTSFRAASSSTISNDLSLLSVGYFLIIVYLAIMLGKFTRLQHKVWLAIGGVLCVGLAILVTFGLSSAFGLFYGPVHSILPFLILGIGVDDVFVIIQSYDNVSKKLPSDTPIPHVIAATMRQAGVAISVTSMTDVIAFLVGATTILPALRSFCIFAGLGILAVFFFSCTFFIACVTFDARRRNARKDACCCCVNVSREYEPFQCAKTDHLQLFFEEVFAPTLTKWPVKVGVLIVTAGIFAAGCYGSVELKQNFDFNLFLPQDSDAVKYNTAKAKYFATEGVAFTVNIADIDYFKEQANLNQVYRKMFDNQYVVQSSVSSWYEKFVQWVAVTHQNSSFKDSDNRPNNETYFYDWLELFFNGQSGASFRSDVTFSNKTGKNRILFSRMHATHIKMENSPAEVKAMDSVRGEVTSVPFSKEAFAYTRFYIGWETNKIIGVELFRNLGLAALCVFLVTLFLIANIWTSLMVLTCVVLTLADVSGMMHFWGLTIDTVTSVMLILAIGLCVDYAAHIGHAFMTARGSSRNERSAAALSEIGPAVLNGGFSTFLAFVCLGASGSYVFKTFFKIFFLVVVFGLLHGLVYLPTLLSLIGPQPYSTQAVKEEDKEDDNDTVVVSQKNNSEENGHIEKGNIEMQNRAYQGSAADVNKP